MAVCEGILTARGGMTSHAAVVARGMNVCCIAGCSGITVDEAKKVLKINSTGQTFHEGDWLSLNGTTGEFYAGQLEVEEPKVGGEFAELLKYADELATLEVRTNADTPHDALVAKVLQVSLQLFACIPNYWKHCSELWCQRHWVGTHRAHVL